MAKQKKNVKVSKAKQQKPKGVVKKTRKSDKKKQTIHK